MTRCEFIPATTDLVLAYYGKPPPFTFKGYVALLDGKPVGVGGIYRDNESLVAFSDMGPEMRARKRDVVRAIHVLKDQFDACKAQLFVIANKDEPTSPQLLARLGFEPTGQETENGALMVRLA